MGLALEMFEFKTWFVYVAVTIVFEAWFIGRALRLGWVKSGVVSVGANAFTAFCCAGGLFAPFLHQPFVGTRESPSPFWNAVILLGLYGLVSAVVEAAFWGSAVKKRGDVGKWRPMGYSLLAHVIGVPIALVILLFPAHPYRGLEGEAALSKRTDLLSNFINPLKKEMMQNGKVPRFHSFQEADRSVGFDPSSPALRSSYFSRFGCSKPLTVDWNSDMDGKTMNSIQSPVWLVRFSDPDLGPIFEFDVVEDELTYNYIRDSY